MLNIIIADDHELVRKGLRLIIDETRGMRVAAEASSAHELLTLLDKTAFDLIILDLNLGDTHGVESVGLVNARFPDMPILVLSSSPEELYAVQSFKEGASGFLNKAVIGDVLVAAINRVANGKKYIAPSLESTLLYGTDLEKKSFSTSSLLSKRELEVLTLISEGKSYKEIAADLGVSPKTVSTYRARVLEKLNLSSTTELLHFAFEHRLQDS